MFEAVQLGFCLFNNNTNVRNDNFSCLRADWEDMKPDNIENIEININYKILVKSGWIKKIKVKDKINEYVLFCWLIYLIEKYVLDDRSDY